MKTLADIEANRIKRLALKGKTKTKMRKFVKALLTDIAGLRADIVVEKSRE